MISKVWKEAFPDQLFQKECNHTETTYSCLLNYKDQLQKNMHLSPKM